MLSRFKKNKKLKNKPVSNSVKVINLINELRERKLLRNEGFVFYIYKDILIGPAKDNIIKNLYFYARLTNLIGTNESILLKDMETSELISVYKETPSK